MTVKEVELDSFAERWVKHGSTSIIDEFISDAQCLNNNFNRLCLYVDKYEENGFEYRVYAKDSITINDYLYSFGVSTNYD